MTSAQTPPQNRHDQIVSASKYSIGTLALGEMDKADRDSAIGRARGFAHALESQREGDTGGVRALGFEWEAGAATQPWTPTDRACWAMDVARLLRTAAGGKLEMLVILARLTRRQKSEEAAWEQIAADFGTNVFAAKEAFYGEAIPLWLMMLGMAGLDTQRQRPGHEWHGAEYRCAVTERSKGEQECPVGSGSVSEDVPNGFIRMPDYWTLERIKRFQADLAEVVDANRDDNLNSNLIRDLVTSGIRRERTSVPR